MLFLVTVFDYLPERGEAPMCRLTFASWFTDRYCYAADQHCSAYSSYRSPKQAFDLLTSIMRDFCEQA